ncbi:putative motility protein [Clostridium estertheticum]|uniref:putative motility protein n=1 Tax=Clostridium estertheticum TaxID=238834 RepID=UPI001C0DE117|nr:YjfB family protein [Clostridium estertheticum]MBU3186008.1 YjfB family protein [Clostridium estertheticum]
MDISPISILDIQTKVQQSADIEVTKITSIEKEKENDKQITEVVHNAAIDPNIGQNLDVVAGVQKDKNEAANKQLQQELKWAKDKQKMLNVKEVKLLQMREIAEQGNQLNSLNPKEQNRLNDRLDSLAAQVSAIESDSRRTKDGKKLE